MIGQSSATPFSNLHQISRIETRIGVSPGTGRGLVGTEDVISTGAEVP